MLPSKPYACPSCTTKSLKYGFRPLDVHRSSTLPAVRLCAQRRDGACRAPAAIATVLINTSPSAVSAGCVIVVPPSCQSCCHRTRAIRRRDADRAGSAQQQDLGDAVDGRCDAASCSCPAAPRATQRLLPVRGVVAGQRSRRSDDDHVVNHERRAREAPIRNLALRVGRNVARPGDSAGARVERVQNAGGPESVNASVAQRRRRSRTGAGVRLPETRRIAVAPHRVHRSPTRYADDDLLWPALLLREERRRPAPRTTTTRGQSAGATFQRAPWRPNSVSIRRPRTTASRWVPRNPAHSTASGRPLACGRRLARGGRRRRAGDVAGLGLRCPGGNRRIRPGLWRRTRQHSRKAPPQSRPDPA